MTPPTGSRAAVPPPDFEADRAHYDLSDEFFKCCLDPSMCYSCAYFETGEETLEQAQLAKIDRALKDLRLSPGARLLEVGHGWGATAIRAVNEWDVRYTGLTLSINHHEYARRLAPRPGMEFRLEGWETYTEPCDAIVSFGAFEHFTSPKYDAFFARCRELLPVNGRLALQTITRGRRSSALSFARHTKMILNDVFPGAEIPTPEQVVGHSRENGFEPVLMESLRFHYAETLERWGENLRANREPAIDATNEKTYEMFIKYFFGSAAFFRSGEYGAHYFVLQAF
jgi:cyclopropane-fatty-acyl-phospholipid synthase